MGWFTDFLQNLLFGLAQGSIYAIVAVGFTIVFSATEVVNFAQGEFVMLGAMFSYWFSAAHPVGAGLPVYLAVPLAVAVTLLVGMALGWVLMRPLKQASATSLIIITVGASMLMQGIASRLWGKDAVAVAPFTNGNPVLITLPKSITGSADAMPLLLTQQHLWLMGLVVAMVVGLSLFFNRTMTGKAMRAVSMNRDGARLVGVNVSRTVILAFALSAAMGALAGAAVAPISCGYYNMGAMMGLKGFAAAIVGGLGNFPGSIAAGLLLGVAEKIGGRYLASEYQDAFAFIILLAVLLFRPQGILSMRKKAVRG